MARDAAEFSNPLFKVFPVAKPELGAKQVCPNCQAKFYDLGRRPAHCPKCATDFDPEEALKLRGRRVRPGYPSDDEDAEDQVKDKSADGDEEDDDTPSTPEIDQEGHEPILTPDDEDEDAPADASEEPGMGSTDGDDDLLDDDDDDSVPFIEDEDDDSFEDDIAKPTKDED